MKLHELAGGTLCERSEGQYLPDDSYREWTFEYQPSWGDEADREAVTLVQVSAAPAPIISSMRGTGSANSTGCSPGVRQSGLRGQV